MERFALHILKLNITAAGIILLVKLVSIFLKGKFTAKWKYVVWLILTFSLLIPVRLPSELSLFHLQINATDQKPSRSQVPQNIPSANSASSTSHSDKSNTFAPVVKTASEQTAKRPVIHIEVRKQYLPVSPHLISTVFLVLWIVVAVIKLICEAAAYRISTKNLKRMSLPVYNPITVRSYSSICRLKGIHSPPKLMQNAGLSSPLLVGLFRSELYLPSIGYNAEELKLIFHHELSHFCHKDLWYKMLLRICATVYWFNPCLRIMLKEAENDIENLCDTNVIRHCTTNDHKLYRRLLLRTVAIQNRLPYVTASLNDSTMVFKDRILYLRDLKKLKNNVLPGILLSILLVTANVSFVLSSSANESASTDNSQNTENNSESTGLSPDISASAAGNETDILEDNPTAARSQIVQMEFSEYEMYTTSPVNIRSLPSMDSGIIRTIPAGSAVRVTGASKSGWLPVTIDNVSGFISREYLTGSFAEAQAAAEKLASEINRDNTEDIALDTMPQENDNFSENNAYDPDDTVYDYSDNDTDDAHEPNDSYDYDSFGSDTSNINDPYDLYSWDGGTNSFIPYQAAGGEGLPIGKGEGWYYYDTESGNYQLW